MGSTTASAEEDGIAGSSATESPPAQPPRSTRRGLEALCLIARLHHIAADPEQLAHQLGWPASHVPGTADLLLAAKHLGLKAKLSRTSLERLPLAPLPALALLKTEDGSAKAVVLAQCDGQRVLFQDPSGEIQGGRPTIEPLDVFAAQWTRELILIASRASLAGELARFDFSWFIPSLVKYRRLLGEVLIVSLFLQLFALVSPLFFQVVMDKVLVHRGLTTLDVLVIGLIVVVLFESVLTVLRTYVFSHTTSRIDVELGARLFRHLLKLPLAYFQARRVGDSVARVRELENIRSFLTGNALTLVLDVAFSVIFIAMMLAYSVPLTLIVLASLPLYAAISLVLVPIVRARLNEKFARGAENQALLVETVTGIQTVKASALEPAIARRWDSQLAAYLVNVATDVVTENANEGTDTIQSGVTWTLGTNVENLTLTGTAAINGTGNTLNNLLVGNAGANTLSGGTGNDTLDGAAGADTMIGGAGADQYLFARGYGVDTIQENDSTGVTDVVQFAAGIVQSDLSFNHVGNNLEVAIAGSSDKIVVQNWYLGSQYHVEQFKLADGTIVTDTQVPASLTAGPASSALSVTTAKEQTAVTAMAAAPSPSLIGRAVQRPYVLGPKSWLFEDRWDVDGEDKRPAGTRTGAPSSDLTQKMRIGTSSVVGHDDSTARNANLLIDAMAVFRAAASESTAVPTGWMPSRHMVMTGDLAASAMV